MGEALDPLVAANDSLADLSTEVGLGAISVGARAIPVGARAIRVGLGAIGVGARAIPVGLGAIGVIARAIPVGLGRFVKKLDGNVGIGSFLGGCVFCATRHG